MKKVLAYLTTPLLLASLYSSYSYSEESTTSACDADFQRLMDQVAELSDESLKAASPPNSYASIITSEGKLAVIESRVEPEDTEESKKDAAALFVSTTRDFAKKSSAIATAVSIPLEIETTVPGANGVISLFLEHRNCESSAWAIPFIRKGGGVIEYGEMSAIPLSISVMR